MLQLQIFQYNLHPTRRTSANNAWGILSQFPQLIWCHHPKQNLFHVYKGQKSEGSNQVRIMVASSKPWIAASTYIITWKFKSWAQVHAVNVQKQWRNHITLTKNITALDQFLVYQDLNVSINPQSLYNYLFKGFLHDASSPNHIKCHFPSFIIGHSFGNDFILRH